MFESRRVREFIERLSGRIRLETEVRTVQLKTPPIEDDRVNQTLSQLASNNGIDFSQIPEEGRELVNAVDDACDAIGLNLQSLLDSARESRVTDPKTLMVYAAYSMALALIFRPTGSPFDGERLYFTADQDSRVKASLLKIVERKGIMEAIDRLFPKDTATIPVGEILRGYAHSPILA